MVGPDTRLTKSTVNGPQTLTARVWDLIDYVGRQHGVALEVGQGGYRGKDGATASAGTHNVGDVFDLRLYNVPAHKVIPIVVDLRRWNGCAWPRTPQYGWTETGPHIHCVMRDSVDGLSYSARAQVALYDRGLNGLANRGKDNLPHPPQTHYVMGSQTGQEDEDVFIFRTHADADKGDSPGGGAAYIVFNGKAVQCEGGFTATPDVPVIGSTSERMDDAFYAAVERFRLAK